MAQINLVEIIPHVCKAVQGSDSAAGKALLEKYGFSPDVVSAVMACIGSDGKLVKNSGKAFGTTDLMSFRICV